MSSNYANNVFYLTVLKHVCFILKINNKNKFFIPGINVLHTYVLFKISINE